MCEHGDTVPIRVRIAAHMSHTGRSRMETKPIDRCIAPLVAALQAAGIDMLGSCCGHGEGDGEILLADGRQMKIATSPPPPEQLRAARDAAGLSLADCKARWGYSRSYLCDIENGRRRVTKRIAQLYRGLK